MSNPENISEYLTKGTHENEVQDVFIPDTTQGSLHIATDGSLLPIAGSIIHQDKKIALLSGLRSLKDEGSLVAENEILDLMRNNTELLKLVGFVALKAANNIAIPAKEIK